jgi:hypothetical protein
MKLALSSEMQSAFSSLAQKKKIKKHTDLESHQHTLSCDK